MSHWLEPPLVLAPDPSDRSKSVVLEISQEFILSNANIYRRSPIFQIWAHVVGQLPPINNVRRLLQGELVPTLTTLEDSVACFRGVKRPYDDEDQGQSVLVYVLNPLVTIDYEPDMACVAKGVRVPNNVVATVQVRPAKDLQISGQRIHGSVTRLEFVAGDRGEPMLPARHSDRYIERLWQSP